MHWCTETDIEEAGGTLLGATKFALEIEGGAGGLGSTRTGGTEEGGSAVDVGGNGGGGIIGSGARGGGGIGGGRLYGGGGIENDGGNCKSVEVAYLE